MADTRAATERPPPQETTSIPSTPSRRSRKPRSRLPMPRPSRNALLFSVLPPLSSGGMASASRHARHRQPPSCHHPPPFPRARTRERAHARVRPRSEGDPAEVHLGPGRGSMWTRAGLETRLAQAEDRRRMTDDRHACRDGKTSVPRNHPHPLDALTQKPKVPPRLPMPHPSRNAPLFSVLCHLSSGGVASGSRQARLRPSRNALLFSVLPPLSSGGMASGSRQARHRFPCAGEKNGRVGARPLCYPVSFGDPAIPCWGKALR